jgi:hypothetical protein
LHLRYASLIEGGEEIDRAGSKGYF